MSKHSRGIDPIEALISGLPDKKIKPETWTLAEDSALLKYGQTKGIANIARALGKSRNAAYNRYNILKEKIKQ